MAQNPRTSNSPEPEHRSLPPVNHVMRILLVVTLVLMGSVLVRNITTAIQDAISVESRSVGMAASTR